MTALQYQITPLDLSGYQESLDELTGVWARQWAAQPLHLRLFAQLVPFRFERLYGPLVAAAQDLPATAWQRPWLLDQAYMYYKQEQRTQPLVLRHWLVLWAEGRLDRPTLTTLLRRAFALPAIVECPCRRSFQGGTAGGARILSRWTRATPPWLS